MVIKMPEIAHIFTHNNRVSTKHFDFLKDFLCEHSNEISRQIMMIKILSAEDQTISVWQSEIKMSQEAVLGK